MPIDRNQVPAPEVPREEIEVPELGGSVTVRGLLLTERLRISSLRAADAAPRPGETDDEAKARADTASVPRLLALTVLASDGQPLWSEAQWQAFGAQHFATALGLFNAAMRLSGFDHEGDRKNS